MTHSDTLRPSNAALRKVHLITSSAAISRLGGTVKPRAFEVVILMTSHFLTADPQIGWLITQIWKLFSVTIDGYFTAASQALFGWRFRRLG